MRSQVIPLSMVTTGIPIGKFRSNLHSHPLNIRFCEICHKPGKVILLVTTLSKAYMKDCDLFLARVEVESINAYHFLSVRDHCLKQISRERRLVTPTLQSLNKTVLEGFPFAKNISDPSHSKRASSISVSRRSNIT